VLRYVTDLRIHPGVEMLKNGLPVVISSDDPGIWSARGLSHDFWEAEVLIHFRDVAALIKGDTLYVKLYHTGVQDKTASCHHTHTLPF
jgi:hypothetical protein